MQRRKRAQVLSKQTSLNDVYPELGVVDVINSPGVRQMTTDIVSAVVQHVQQQKVLSTLNEPLHSDLPSIVQNALHELALEKAETAKSLPSISKSLTNGEKDFANEPNLDLLSNLKHDKKPRNSVPLKVANQIYMLSSDADIDYMQTISREANLLLQEVKRQLPRGDKQAVFVLALLNALDEKADMTFKFNEQSDRLQQVLNLSSELEKRKAVLERKIQTYRKKLADLATIFTEISERFSLYKSDPNFSSKNFQKMVLQILEGEENENQMANFSQMSLQDCLQLERKDSNE